jgi:lysozyme
MMFALPVLSLPDFKNFVMGLGKALFAGAISTALAGCFTYGAIKGDNKPHPGVAAARAMPIQGIDISRYQGRVDYNAARKAGTHFVFMKATEGADYVDPNFRENWQGAKAAGMPRGAYHFMAWCSLAKDQAEWFKRNVPADPDALPPVLDLEWNNSSSCKPSHSREDVLEKIHVMLAAMEAHTGKIPVIYTDINFHRDILSGEHFDNSFWLRSTAAHPHQRYQNRQWSFWQWTQTGTMPGVRGEVDRNAFYGSESDWVRFLLTGCDPRLGDRLAVFGKCGGVK